MGVPGGSGRQRLLPFFYGFATMPARFWGPVDRNLAFFRGRRDFFLFFPKQHCYHVSGIAVVLACGLFFADIDVCWYGCC